MFSGMESLFKEDFIEDVPTLKELSERYAQYKNNDGDDFEGTIASKESMQNHIYKIIKL